MKGEKRLTGMARVIGLLIALALILSLLLPLVASAQEAAEDEPTTEVLAEVPSTGGSRMGPIVQAASRVAAPEPEPEPEPEPNLSFGGEDLTALFPPAAPRAEPIAPTAALPTALAALAGGVVVLTVQR